MHLGRVRPLNEIFSNAGERLHKKLEEQLGIFEAEIVHIYTSVFLLTFAFLSAATAHPSRWHNVFLDVDVAANDPNWFEIVSLRGETEGEESEQPLLVSGRQHDQQSPPETLDLVPLDDRTKKFRELVLRRGLLKRSDTIPQLVVRMLGSIYIKKLVASAKTRLSCGACVTSIRLLLFKVRRSHSSENLIKLAKRLCINLRVKTPEACEGIMRMFGMTGRFKLGGYDGWGQSVESASSFHLIIKDRVVYVLQRIRMEAEQICSFVDMCGEVSNPNHEWEVSFPPVPKPAITKFVPVEVDERAFKVLQISDTHVDLHYQEGMNATCEEMLCCRESSGRPKSPAHGAGRWGDYRKCDTPLRTLDNLLEHISSTHRDIDYILWTGDLNPHDLWKRTREENVAILRQTAEKMKSHFPGIPIFAALGNHDSFPPYGFPPPFIEQTEYLNDWWYAELNEQWGHWLPSESSSRTIKRGAFYSVLVRPGFRIISLNMNFCLKKNWWLLIDSKDPANELQWLVYELQTAEFNAEKVHVIGHIPPGDTDCLKVWSRNYYKIVARYESTITGQFFGHTHFDEFELFYDPEDLTRPVNIAYLGPSVTTYIGLNPGYRIYYIDGDRDNSTRAVLDYETWVMHLNEANNTDHPVWYKLYSAKNAYRLNHLMPSEWNYFVQILERDEESFSMFYKHYWKNSFVRPLCESKCKEDIICNLRSGRSHDQKTLCGEKKEKKPEKKYTRKISRRLSLKSAISCGSNSATLDD